MSKIKKLFLFLAIMLLTVPDAFAASPAAMLTVTKTVYLEQGTLSDPRAMVRTHDNGFIIVGSIDRKDHPKTAWAIKTNGEGSVIWRYLLPAPEKIPQFYASAYLSAAVMPDDSVFLCGMSGELTHLDKEGNVLNQQVLRPEGFDRGGFRSCAVWDGGIIAIGGTAHLNPPDANGIVRSQPFYWIIALEGSGKKKWEKVEPVPSKMFGFPDAISSLRIVSNGNFVFAGGRGIFTEVIQVKPNGDITTGFVDGGLITVRENGTEKNIQLVSASTETLTLVTLNDKLQEIGRISEKHEFGDVGIAYHLSDQSLIMFGSKHSSEGYAARVLRVNPTLKEENTLLLGTAKESYDLNVAESYEVKVAVPLDNPDEFLSVRRVMKPAKQGLALDTISFN